MKTKLLINGKKYKVNLGGAKYLFNWNPEVVPDTPVVPDVPTWKLCSETYEFDESMGNGYVFETPSGYDGMRSIELASVEAFTTFSVPVNFDANQGVYIDFNPMLSGTPEFDNDAENIFRTIDTNQLFCCDIFSGDDYPYDRWVLTYFGDCSNCMSSNSSYERISADFPEIAELLSQSKLDFLLKFVRQDDTLDTSTAYFFINSDDDRNIMTCLAVEDSDGDIIRDVSRIARALGISEQGDNVATMVLRRFIPMP